MAKTVHGTLTPNVVEVVTLSGHGNVVEVLNRSYASLPGSTIWVRVDGHDPVVEGDDSYVVLGARTFDIRAGRGSPVTSPARVRLLSVAAVDYSVESGGY